MFLLILGIAITVMNGKVIEGSVSYGELCPNYGQYCMVSFTIDEEMKPPVLLFYELTNFYQNHRRYLKSKSPSQLKGEKIEISDADSACDPVVLNRDLYVKKSWGGYDLDPNQVANPCGLMAKSIFNGKKKRIYNVKL